jgi:GT2 family glycosyltransferase
MIDTNARISVIIPSCGRPQVLEDTIASVFEQTVAPTEVILSVVSTADVTAATASAPSVRVVYGPRGLTVQRNTAIQRMDATSEFVLFLDDDVELVPSYIENSLNVFEARQDVVVVTGHFLAENVTRGEARRIVASACDDSSGLVGREIVEARSAFGGNMCIRAWLAREVSFDEQLPLYGWLEDLDWSARAARHGRIVWSRSSAMVHLHVSSGRISPKQFGYAQVVNPYYLWKKQSIRSLGQVITGYWMRSLPRNIVSCMIGSNRAGRFGRLHGNALAVCDLLQGKITPMRVVELERATAGRALERAK